MIGTSRRTLVRAGALGVFATPFLSAWSALAAPSTDLYARTRFARLQSGAFTLVDATGSWSLTLTQVSDLPGAAAGDERRFGLTFRSTVAGPPQGSYTLRRPGFTATPLFVVPSDAGRRTYEAVVNRT